MKIKTQFCVNVLIRAVGHGGRESGSESGREPGVKKNGSKKND